MTWSDREVILMLKSARCLSIAEREKALSNIREHKEVQKDSKFLKVLNNARRN